MDAITAIRARRAEMNVPPSKKAHYTVATAHADVQRRHPFLKRLAYASDVTMRARLCRHRRRRQGQVDTHAARIFMPLAELVDFEKELARIAKEKANAEKQLAGIENKLKNEGFLAISAGGGRERRLRRCGKSSERLLKSSMLPAAMKK